MKIKLKDAIALFAAIGFEGTDKWTDERFNIKFQKLGTLQKDKPEDLPPSKDITDKPARKLYDSILASLKKGDAVEIESDEPEKPADKKETKKGPGALADDDDKPSTKGASKTAADKKKDTKKPAAAKPASTKLAEKDRWGARLGTGAAAVNVCLGKTPKTTDEIVKESKVLKATVQERLWMLRAVKKVIDKNDKGWFVLPAKK